jgi:hypothetical protein
MSETTGKGSLHWEPLAEWMPAISIIGAGSL